MASEREQQVEPTFAEAVLGKNLLRNPWVQRWLALPATYRVAAGIALFAGLLYVPFVGAVGLWDPWETHYGEVARMMVHRRDYVFPYWENAWFFSKPPLTMWLQALGMQIVGTNRTTGAVALLTEWGMRMPFVLLSILALILLGLAVYRVAGRRAGWATAVVLATMPLYWLLTRQTVTDTPFVTTLICAMACAIIGQLDEGTRHRAGWWYGFYVFAGFSTLAKGLLGFGLPAVILLLYACLSVIPWDRESLDAHARWLSDAGFRREVREGKRPMPLLWGQFFKMRLGTGILVFLAVAAPWFARLIAYEGVDDEGQRFWYRFFIHDHLNRLAAGVHTTTPGGTFIYFIEQGGYAIFPWVALLPGALAVVSRVRLRGGDKRDHLVVLGTVWAVFSFGLVGLSATKFHHYVFPVLPGVAILIALFVDELWEEGIPAHAGSLILGLLLFVIVGKDLSANPKNFTDLFVYNYDRPYPNELVDKPMSFFGQRSLMMRDLVTTLLLGYGLYSVVEAFRNKQRMVGARALGLALLLSGVGLTIAATARNRMGATMSVGLALVLVALYLIYEIGREPKEGRPALIGAAGGVGLAALALTVYGVNITMANRSGRGPLQVDGLEAALLQPVNVKLALGMAFTVGGGLCVIALLQRAKTVLYGGFLGLAVCFALWFNWNHWVDLSHHWTQRDLFWRYYRQRGSPDEPITAFLMNWRGETFYSRNTVKQIKDNGMLARYAALPGRKWALVEHNRLPILRGAAGADKVITPIDRDLNNKFVLVKIE